MFSFESRTVSGDDPTQHGVEQESEYEKKRVNSEIQLRKLKVSRQKAQKQLA